MGWKEALSHSRSEPASAEQNWKLLLRRLVLLLLLLLLVLVLLLRWPGGTLSLALLQLHAYNYFFWASPQESI